MYSAEYCMAISSADALDTRRRCRCTSGWTGFAGAVQVLDELDECRRSYWNVSPSPVRSSRKTILHAAVEEGQLLQPLVAGCCR